MFAYIGPLNRHCRERLWCSNCFIVSNSYDSWIEHIKIHHIEAKQLLCDKCNVKFLLLIDFITHIGTKHLEASFSCDKCSRPFEKKRDFTKHDCEMPPYEQLMEDGHDFQYDEDGYVVG